MPDDVPALEAANKVAGQRHQKLFHAEMVFNKTCFYRRKQRERRKKLFFVSFVCFCVNQFLFDSQVRAGKDHANNAIGEFHFVEIDDESHGYIQQFHVAQQLRLVNG